MTESGELQPAILVILRTVEAKSFADRALFDIIIRRIEQISGRPLLSGILMDLEDLLGSQAIKTAVDIDQAELISNELSTLIDYLKAGR